MATRISRSEADRQAAIRASRSMFGCGNGGRDFDEPGDPNELLDALTDDERLEAKARRAMDLLSVQHYN